MMSPAGVPGTAGPFRGLIPYDETGAALFFGRQDAADRLYQQVVRDGARASALTGDAGVGKTSLLRAGLLPRLTKHGILGVYLPGEGAWDQEVLAAATRAGAEPPASGESAVDYLVRVAVAAPSGTVLILDHLDRALSGDAAPAELISALGRAANAAGPRLRFLFCLDRGNFHRLDRLAAPTGLSPAAGFWMELDPLSQEEVEQIFEQTSLQTGTFLEAGLAAAIAGDLCRGGSCLPLDLQIVSRAVFEQRLTSLRRYERSGGATLIIPSMLERATTEAGGLPARRILSTLCTVDEATAEAVTARTRQNRASVDQALAVLSGRGLLRKRTVEREERFALSHGALARHISELTMADRLRADATRRRLRRATLTGERLRLRDLLGMRKHLGGAIDVAETATLRRGIRRAVIELGLAFVVATALVVALGLDARRAYTLALDPAEATTSARVVVRAGRSFLPAAAGPARGRVIADTGFSASALPAEFLDRVSSGKVTGTTSAGGRDSIPPWLRTVLDSLRPVPRGVALVLLGDPAGITSLKQGFADPTSRREALESLAVIGNGRAGEDEILAAALGDPSPEVRRRGVEVAASIDRRLGRGSHGTTLRSALGDGAQEVKMAVLNESATLPPAEAAEILAVALSDKDAAFRRLAEQGVLALAVRSPAAAAETVKVAVRSPDGQARRNGLDLLERLAATTPAEVASTLADLLADEKTPEEVRIAVLVHMRQAGSALAPLKAVLEKAARAAESSPRLRAAALPLFARLIDPAEAEAMALADGKGPPAQRAAAAAVWGAIAAQRPETATRALKAGLYDPSPEVRIEAARSYGALKREGATLVQKALLDPNAEVMRAALASAVELAPAQPYVIGEALGRAFKLVRPGLRRPIIETMGRIGRERPAAVVAPLARALREGDGGSRAAAATALCGLAKKAPEAVTPYLRVAARDPDRDVRAAAAGCLANLGSADPKAAARLASELALSDEAAVRAAAAISLGDLAATAKDGTLPALLKLSSDPDRAVRAAALRGLRAYGHANPSLGRHAEDLEKALLAYMLQGDAEERRSAIEAGADAHLGALLRRGAGDVDETVRLEAVKRAAAAGAEGQGILQTAVEDRSSLVRAEAIRHLALTRGEGARKILPVFQAMLRASDPATQKAGVAALGEMADAAAEAATLLDELLRQRSEALRAAAAVALGRLTARNVGVSTRALEGALSDSSHDVRSAAIRGLAAAWARRKPIAELGRLLEDSDDDSARRLVVLEALVLNTAGDKRDEAVRELRRLADTGTPLARLLARVGHAFATTGGGDVHEFLERLLGG